MNKKSKHDLLSKALGTTMEYRTREEHQIIHEAARRFLDMIQQNKELDKWK